MKKPTLLRFIAILGCAGFLAACNTTLPAIPGAQHVLVTTYPIPKSCTFLDPVYVSYVDNAHCAISNQNSLKNQAYGLGGNVIAMTPPQTATQVLAGNAYYCSNFQ